MTIKRVSSLCRFESKISKIRIHYKNTNEGEDRQIFGKFIVNTGMWEG